MFEDRRPQIVYCRLKRVSDCFPLQHYVEEYFWGNGTVVSIVLACELDVVWSSHATGERARCVTRPRNSCEGDYRKRGTDAVYFCWQLFRHQWLQTIEYVCLRLFKLNWKVRSRSKEWCFHWYLLKPNALFLSQKWKHQLVSFPL